MLFFEILKRKMHSVDLTANLLGINPLQKNETPLVELPEDLQSVYQLLQLELEQVQDVMDRIGDQEAIRDENISKESLKKHAQTMQALLDEFVPAMKSFTLIEVIFDSEIKERFSVFAEKNFCVREGKFLVEATAYQYKFLEDFLFKYKAIQLDVLVLLDKNDVSPGVRMN